MIAPSFWDDHYIGKLSSDERLFILGCVSSADDEGRLKKVNPAYLKAAIFMYDDKDVSAVQNLKESCLSKMEAWPENHPYRMVPYQNAGEDYLCFPRWGDTQRPSHPTKSKLPTPPPEVLPLFSRETPEALKQPSRETPPQSSLVQEDFTEFFDSETDLTDFLTTTLAKYASRGAVWLSEVLRQFWGQRTGGEMSDTVFQVAYTAVKDHPPDVLARAFVKAAKYGRGKTNPARYLRKVLEEKAKPP